VAISLLRLSLSGVSRRYFGEKANSGRKTRKKEEKKAANKLKKGVDKHKQVWYNT
jgi:hypothetical protein